jgi:hypothetical protein
MPKKTILNDYSASIKRKRKNKTLIITTEQELKDALTKKELAFIPVQFSKKQKAKKFRQRQFSIESITKLKFDNFIKRYKYKLESKKLFRFRESDIDYVYKSNRLFRVTYNYDIGIFNGTFVKHYVRKDLLHSSLRQVLYVYIIGKHGIITESGDDIIAFRQYGKYFKWKINYTVEVFNLRSSMKIIKHRSKKPIKHSKKIIKHRSKKPIKHSKNKNVR